MLKQSAEIVMLAVCVIGISFSSLTRRIIFLNVTGLLTLVIGILYLSQFRAGLIDARRESLLVQGEIIAGAVAASATVETDTITIDPERLLDLQAGESYGPSDEALSGLEFPINPERIAPVLRRLVSPTNTRARIFDRDGGLILEWVNHVDLMRIKGVGSEYSDLLEAAGVDSPAELAHRNASNLATTVQEVVAARPGIVRRVPTEAEIQGWIDQSKDLPKVVEH